MRSARLSTFPCILLQEDVRLGGAVKRMTSTYTQDPPRALLKTQSGPATPHACMHGCSHRLQLTVQHSSLLSAHLAPGTAFLYNGRQCQPKIWTLRGANG